MINIKTDVGLEGRYLLIKRNAKGEVVQTAEFSNLITNIGLDQLGLGGAMTSFFVGAGTNAATTTETQMGSYVATTSATGSTNGAAPVTPDYVSTRNLSGRFAAGVAAGNLTEIGIGWFVGGSPASDHRVFSRARIVDGGGNPTTITVLADEVLDVIYTLKAYRDLTDKTYSIVISGVTYSVLARPSLVAQNVFSATNLAMGASKVSVVYAGPIADITDSPTGESVGTSSQSTVAPYVPGSYSRTSSSTAGLQYGNVTGGIQSVRLTTEGFLVFLTQAQFTPKIPKDSNKVLTITSSYSWARRP